MCVGSTPSTAVYVVRLLWAVRAMIIGSARGQRRRRATYAPSLAVLNARTALSALVRTVQSLMRVTLYGGS
jgi:hypothetical protein